MCFGAFSILDQFAGIILQFIPFYYFLKLGFLVYLFHPGTMGATRVFDDFIAPYYNAHKQEIEDVANKAFNKAKNLADEA